MRRSRRSTKAALARAVSPIGFGREICGDLTAAEQREWLVTNGLGGFASGTVAGLLTRRYHGLLVAALKPPLGRTLLVAKLDETAEYDGQSYLLSTNRWADGIVNPHGYRHVESFHLEGTTPVWIFACGDTLLEKRIWMEQGANTTYVRYTLLRGTKPTRLALKALVNYRDFHGSTHAGEWRMRIELVDKGLRVVAFGGATPFYLRSAEAMAEMAHDWHRDFSLAAEGYPCDREDHLRAGTFQTTLSLGDSVTVVLSTEAQAGLDGATSEERQRAHERTLFRHWESTNQAQATEAPAWVQQLVLAADQFVVRRPLDDDPEARSLIAGYHWFSDWGRDAMIALPGLTLTTGRPEIARSILGTFARFVNQGMLPNVFPDTGDPPEYNTVDATLWYFEALRQYWETTGDTELLRELFPVLADILDWHLRGTRYGIRVDDADGLLRAGEPGVQLTWMDAKAGDWVVTPRIGKPVEVNALWLNSFVTMERFAHELGKPVKPYRNQAKKIRRGFQRFWNSQAGFCYDVIDGGDGNDASLRPNQIFAVSLPDSPLTQEQRRAVVQVCARHLLTSHGLRSLAPHLPEYQGRYGGDLQQRDGAYHQGTVWGWLLGPFALAHLRVCSDPAVAMSFLEPMSRHLTIHGVGTASEIFDGDHPFAARGCIAQAWTVAELLRAWHVIQAA